MDYNWSVHSNTCESNHFSIILKNEHQKPYSKEPLFSKNKTKCMHFCQLRKMQNDSTLQLNNNTIPRSAEIPWKNLSQEADLHSLY